MINKKGDDHMHGVQMHEKRSVGLSILLSIITCGIYGLYWAYQLLNTLYRLNNRPSSAGLDIVLALVTCGIYAIYLGYKMGKMESGANMALGLPFKDDSVLYLILALFGLSLVNSAIIQSNINSMPSGGSGFGPGQGPGFGYGPNQNQGNGPHGGGFF